MIALIDYGLGNIQALANIYKRINIPFVLESPNEMEEASHLILPGIGAFDWAIERLHASGLLENLIHLVLDEKKPVLGICVGMQIMAKTSDEGNLAGLGWFDANVKRFDEEQLYSCKHLPHMGWNDVDPVNGSGLFKGLKDSARFYFLHSYYFYPKFSTDIIAYTEYGASFACAVQRENIYGVEFNPEKSLNWGIQLLKNFASL